MMEEQEVPIIDAVCDMAPPLVHFCDNLSSECTAGLYDKYMSSGHRRRIEQLHAAGVKCAVHLDGTVKGLLPKLVRSGFDAIEALTPKPAGDLDIEEMQDLAASDTLILWGGVPGVMLRPLTRGTKWSARPATLGVLAGSAFCDGRGRPSAARRRHRVLPQDRSAHFILTSRVYKGDNGAAERL